MKKIFILVLIAFLLQSCSAYVACLLGWGPSTIRGGSSWKDPVGMQVGIETKIMEVNDHTSLSSGLNFTLQGAGYEETYVSGRVRLGYLNVPLIYTYETPSKIYGEIGLQPGVLLVAKDKYDGKSYDYKDAVNKFELGLPVGVGYKINDQMSVGVRGTYGITNLDSDDGSDHNLLVVGMFRYTIDWSKLK